MRGGIAYTYADDNSYSDCHGYSYSYSYGYTDRDTNADACRQDDTNSETASYSAAKAVGLGPQ